MLCAATNTVGFYALFSHNGKPELFCAIRHGAAAPGFLTAGPWTRLGVLTSQEAETLPGFQQGAARYAVDRIGFYVFQFCGKRFTLAPQPSQATARQRAGTITAELAA